MALSWLLLLALSGHVSSQNPPDVDCVVVHLEHVRCSWNSTGPSAVNYRLYGRFAYVKEKECSSYVTKNDINSECIFPYGNKTERFHSFNTRLVPGNFSKTHDLKKRVILRPPDNLTAKLGPDSNLWFYWNQTHARCVNSEVRFRTANRKWKSSPVSMGVQDYCIHLPSNKFRYELQARSRIDDNCGGSVFWSEWCQPVGWGSNNTTGHSFTLTDDDSPRPLNPSVPVWTVVIGALGSMILILLALMLLQRERLRVIFIPVVPKPMISQDFENWLQISKGLKEEFRTSYNELACPIREFCPVPQCDLLTSTTPNTTSDQQ